jgi:hypothetical protein
MIHIYLKKNMYAIIVVGYVCVNKPINQISTLNITDWRQFEVHNLATFVVIVGGSKISMYQNWYTSDNLI